MRRRVALIALGLVLLCGLAVAPAAGTTPAFDAATDFAATEESTQNISVVYDVTLPDEGADRIVLEITAANVDGANVGFTLFGSDIEVRDREGFTVSNSRLKTTDDGDTASITVAYDPSERLVDDFQNDFVATSEWALFRITTTVPDGIALEEEVTPDGVRGPTFVFVGDHTTHERTVGDDRIVLVEPAAADLVDPADEIVATIAEASRYLRVGAREEETLAFAAPQEMRRGGAAGTRGGEFWVRADRTLGQNTWTHEYVHLRQDRDYFSRARWLAEGEARYYQHLVAAKTGDLSTRGFEGFDAFSHQLRQYHDHEGVRLVDPLTWESNAEYEKGARVIAALDAEIRERTDGDRDYRHVMHRLNRRSHVTGSSVQSAAEAVTGDSMDAFFDAYVRGPAMPPVPNDASLYRDWPTTPNVSYTITDSVETDAQSGIDVPGRAVYSRETVNVTYVVEQTGRDPGLYPRLGVDAPSGWTVEAFDVDGIGWTKEGEVNAAGEDIAPGAPVEIRVELVAPEEPRTGDTVDLILTDEDGERIERNLEVSVVDPVTANLSVNQALHPPGTDVTLDASMSDVPRGATSYRWDLTGDGEFDRVTDGPILEHIFDPGGREVSVAVTNDIGVRDASSVRVNTTDTPRIETPERVVVEEGQWKTIPVNVSNEVGATELVWTLPEGNTSAGSATFRADAGHYPLQVRAVDEFGAASSNATVEFLSVDRPELRMATPNYTPAHEPVPFAVDVANEIGNHTVTWTLPGNTTVEGASFERSLPPGEHDVTVRVVDEYGLEDNLTASVVVSDVPNVSLDGPSGVTATDEATFTAEVTNAFGWTSTSWHVDDRLITVGTERLTTSLSPGEHNVTVRVEDEYGLVTSETVTVTVDEPSDRRTDADERTPDDGGPADAVPGFGLALAIAALLGASLFARARMGG